MKHYVSIVVIIKYQKILLSHIGMLLAGKCGTSCMNFSLIADRFAMLVHYYCTCLTVLCLLSIALERCLKTFVTSFLNWRMLGSFDGLVCMSVGVQCMYMGQ